MANWFVKIVNKGWGGKYSPVSPWGKQKRSKEGRRIVKEETRKEIKDWKTTN